MNKQKILICLPNDILGGAEQYLKMIASHFSNLGFKVVVEFLTATKSGGWDDIGQSVILNFGKSHKEKTAIFYFLKRMVKYRSVKFDYVFTSHTHLSGVVGLLRRTKLLQANAVVCRESTTIFSRFKGLRLIMFKAMYQVGYRNVDLVICQTFIMKDQLVSALPWLVRYTKVVVIPNPIDYNAIQRNVAKQVEHLDAQQLPFVVSAGRLIEEKGFDILIQAFALVKKQFPDYQLIILGEGPKALELKNLSDRLGISNSVHFHGFVKNVYPYFRQATVCCVSSRVEGFPNVLLQMMSVNSCVVSTLCAGGIDTIPGLYIAKPTNVEGISKAIMEAATQVNIFSALNRKKFDAYLEKRDINNFVKTLRSEVITSNS